MVSVVIPLHNEEENITSLVGGIIEALIPVTTFEVILVDDGSKDNTRNVALKLAQNFASLRVIAHEKAGGQSAAVNSGVLAARALIIVTLDGDGQNPPENLPALVAPFLANNHDPKLALVAGQRVARKDTFSKRVASSFSNKLRSAILHDNTRDTGCGLKAFRKDVYLTLPFFNHQHRFLPALFMRDGWKVAHVDVTHQPRHAGQSKYNNFQRAIVGISDLFGVAWLIRRRKKTVFQEITPISANDTQPQTALNAKPAGKTP